MNRSATRRHFLFQTASSLAGACSASLAGPSSRPPNIVLLYADDLGFGDLSCYGARRTPTPNIDRLAAGGLRFTDAHATSATCTPSRYSLLTGEYAWRRKDTGIARGNAAALIPPGRPTLASTLQKAGYATAAVGKWHLGLGPQGGPNWDGEIAPGPGDIGFDYSFLIPATGDRVPCVFVENRRVVGLDPADPIAVSFDKPILAEPTGKDHPELLKMHPSHGHDQTIVNGVSRIGYMSGGKAARWVDEDIADTLTQKAIRFMEAKADRPFFLYFATQDIHVPRMPHSRFADKSGQGARGDVILQLDWCVGQILDTLDRLGLSGNTLVLLSSDNGPVVDDGYRDRSVELLQDHKPAGPLRGGKYSAFDGGTRVPFLVRWPGKVRKGTSPALFSQVDLYASLAALAGQSLPPAAAPDSRNHLPSLLGMSNEGREYAVEHSASGALSILRGGWKYIAPHPGPRIDRNVQIELGNDSDPQLYDLRQDLGERNNLAPANPSKVRELSDLLQKVQESPRTRV